MKKNNVIIFFSIFLLITSFFSCSNSHEDKIGTIEIKVIPKSGTVKFFVSSNDPITINWGNGRVEEKDAGKHVVISGYYDDSEMKTIYITSTSFTEFSFSVFKESKIGNFTSLKFKDCDQLYEANCWNATLQTLEFAGCESLKVLECSNNQLEKLNLSSLKSLQSINCSKNKISSLDASPCKKLTELACSFNNMKNLKVEEMSNLEMLFCDNNDLENLSLKGDKNIWCIECYGNNLNGDAINDLFESLPKVQKKTNRETGWIKLNLAGNNVNKKIAEDKNWIVDDFPAFRVFY